MKYAWVAAHDKEFDVSELCRILAVSVSGYQAWKRGGTPDQKRLTDIQLLLLIKAVHQELKEAYGSPRMIRELRARSYPVSKERVERLMRDNGIYARNKKRFKVTTNSEHSRPVAQNLLDRKFNQETPNKVWTGDITYIRTTEGWLYLAVILDLFNREVIGWSISERMTANIVVDALKMAWFRRKPPHGVMHHSDRGSQYASNVFQTQLKEYGMICSMSRKGNCWDNAPTESFFNSLKSELIQGNDLVTRKQAKANLFEYIEAFYNCKRLHSTLGYVSPKTYMKDWIAFEQNRQIA